MIWNLVKDLWLLFGRLFPFPTRPGLRRVGNPGRSSPVLVTCNFELTVRRVIQTLKRDGVDAWLLVAPTKGINVWCAAAGGHFTTDTIVSVINTSGIESMVNHRKLILPQLSAPGVNSRALKERTGWNPRFGPVDIRHLSAFLGNEKAGQEVRCVRFPIRDRFVMGLNLGFNSLLFLLLPMLVVSVWKSGLWWKSIPLVFSLAVLNTVLVFRLPGKPGVQKGFLLGLMASALFVTVSQAVWGMGPWETMGWTGWIVFLSTYLGYDMPGWSPLWRADVKELVLGLKCTLVEVLPEQCSGCGLCTTVCPAGVFELDAGTRRSRVVNLDACQACGACIENCPKEAIASNFSGGVCSCPTCTVINATRSLGRATHNQNEPDVDTAASARCCDSRACQEERPTANNAGSKAPVLIDNVGLHKTTTVIPEEM